MDFIDCSKVRVGFDNYGGYGAFARVDIKKNEVIERGMAHLVQADGQTDPHLFTWSKDRTKWAYPSGCATYYNTSLKPNTQMYRDFTSMRFEIIALRDIKKGEELTHEYMSLRWREAFKDLYKELQSEKS